MATNSKIEWTEMTWNLVTGCTRVSEGCRHCYAERLAERLDAMGNRRYVNGFRVTLHDDMMDLSRREAITRGGQSLTLRVWITADASFGRYKAPSPPLV